MGSTGRQWLQAGKSRGVYNEQELGAAPRSGRIVLADVRPRQREGEAAGHGGVKAFTEREVGPAALFT